MSKYFTTTFKNEKYRIVNKIGQGSFGQIFIVSKQNQQKNKSNLYAIKLVFQFYKEQQNTKTPILFKQVQILKKISFPQVRGIPQLIDQGSQKGYNFLVIDLLGPSLKDLFIICQNKFSLKTTIMLAIQIVFLVNQLDIIQYIHENQYIYRDIKPENFLFGIKQKSHILYLTDFGLSKKYKIDEIHIPYKQSTNFLGTLRYASINSHFGIQQSRRDDLQSIAYMLIYFLKGTLPWQIHESDKREKKVKIFQKKLSLYPQILCKDLPIEFNNFLIYAKDLKYEERPDYQFLRNEFLNLFFDLGFVYDNSYDWCEFQKTKSIKQKNRQLKIQGFSKLKNIFQELPLKQKENKYGPNINIIKDINGYKMQLDQYQQIM